MRPAVILAQVKNWHHGPSIHSYQNNDVFFIKSFLEAEVSWAVISLHLGLDAIMASPGLTCPAADTAFVGSSAEARHPVSEK